MKMKIVLAMPVISIILMACASNNAPVTSSQSSFVPASPHKRGFDDKPYFKRGSDDLDATARTAVAVAAKLILRQRLRVNIVGHTDNRRQLRS